MREDRKFRAWMAALGVWAVVVLLLPTNFLSFAFAVVGGGMIAMNAGEQLRKDRERRGRPV